MLVSCFGLYSLFQTPGSKTIRFENENDVRVRDLTERPVFRVQSTHTPSMEIEKSSSCGKFEANGWGGNAIKQQSIKGWTLNLNWRDKKVKTKN